jgi:hypothetical protein
MCFFEIEKKLILLFPDAPMKNIALLALGFFCLAACKKSYTCECSTSSVIRAGNSHIATINSGGNVPFSQKMTKKQAKAACQHEQDAVQSDFINGIISSRNLELQSDESVITTCSLK